MNINKKNKKSYSSSEKKAYWIGYGMGFSNNSEVKVFTKNFDKKTADSFYNGWISGQNKYLNPIDKKYK